ncbi:MAG: HNH endonuclease [Ilumatobacteraceae bacterium]
MDEYFDLHVLSPSPERVTFDQCPICLSMGPMTAEHVPPEAVGGTVVTSTCVRCNNELGSSIDRPFVDSMFGKFGSFKLSTEASNGVQGFRTYRNVRIARGKDHERAVWIDGERNSDLRPLLGGATQFEAKMQIPDPKAVGLGELKSLYLACCVVAGEILSGETADRLRADLVAVRDNRAELADRDVVDVTQWVRYVQPFEVEITRPESLPVHQAVVARGGRLIPAVGWLNYTCESPFSDSPELSARLDKGLHFVERQLEGPT